MAAAARVEAIASAVSLDKNVYEDLLASAEQTDLTKSLDDAVKKLVDDGKLNKTDGQRLQLANSLGDISNNNVGLMKAVDAKPGVDSIKDVALKMAPQEIISSLDSSPGVDKPKVADKISRTLFASEASSVVRRMLKSDNKLVPDGAIAKHVDTFLGNQPDFDIAKTPVKNVIASPNAFANIPESAKPTVVDTLKKVQLLQAITPVPEAMSALSQKGFATALSVSSVPKPDFIKAFSPQVGDSVASEIHQNAQNASIRNEQMLISLLQNVKGTGLQIIDGIPQIPPMEVAQKAAQAQGIDINFDRLFGGMDQCECDDCATVYSAASYLVDILNYLRSPFTESHKSAFAISETLTSKDIVLTNNKLTGTPLEKLLRRRPDLASIELTCENTNTVLPYIDLANEVMESFVVHLSAFAMDPNTPKQATIDAYNSTEDKSSEELLSEAQNTNLEAYRVLADAVYPSSLPFHLPLETIRTYLKYLSVERWEMIDAFRPHLNGSTSVKLSKQIQDEIIGRSVQAEFLGFTHEEYILLTKEAFWPRQYFIDNGSPNLSEKEYRSCIGVKPTYQYYGYTSESQMLDLDENIRVGLKFVKAQFLNRAGVDYSTLAELVQTKFINPRFPEGRSKRIMDSLRFSYRFLQTLVDPGVPGLRSRFDKLANFLKTTKLMVELTDLLASDTAVKSSKSGKKGECCCDDDIEDWICDNFESLGKLIVLDSGEGPFLAIEGEIFAAPLGDVSPNSQPPKGPWKALPSGGIGTLFKDGRILDADGKLMAEVNLQSRVLSGSAVDEVTLTDRFKDFRFDIRSASGNVEGFIDPTGTLQIGDSSHAAQATWNLMASGGGECNIDNVRLTHLDGTALETEEWDRIRRFIRFWRKLGWTVSQIDLALIGATPRPESLSANGTIPSLTIPSEPVTLDNFARDVPDDTLISPSIERAMLANISPHTLAQIGSVKKLLPLTGLDLDTLLVFFADIPTTGDNSMYKKLFFNFNILPFDDEYSDFRSDANGNYFTLGKVKISDHIPVLMAALGLKAEDIRSKVFAKLNDELNIASISMLYRYSLLAGILGVDVNLLDDVFDVLNYPFDTPDNALRLLETWQAMEKANFSFSQLNYVFRGVDDPTSPLGPSDAAIIQTTQTLYTGLQTIDAAHPNIDKTNAAAATTELVKSAAQLLYDQTTVGRIVGLLNGTNTYETNAPKDLPLDFSTSYLSKKLKYSKSEGTLQITGILRHFEIIDAKALIDTTKGIAPSLLENFKKAWSEAIDRLRKQPSRIIQDVLADILPADAEQILLAGDIPEDQGNAVPSPGSKPSGSFSGTQSQTNGLSARTLSSISKVQASKSSATRGDDSKEDSTQDGQLASSKRICFLSYFIPFLRQELYKVLILDIMSAVGALDSRELTETVLSSVLVSPEGKPSVHPSDASISYSNPTSALTELMHIHVSKENEGSKGNWNGFLLAPTTNDYTFFIESNTSPPPITLDGKDYRFPHQMEDPSNVWSTEPIGLTAGRLYPLYVGSWIDSDASPVSGASAVNTLQWRTDRLPTTQVPSTALLPSYATGDLSQIFKELVKVGIVVNGFNLSAEEIRYLNSNMADFGGRAGGENFIQLSQWRRFLAYQTLRDSLPTSDINLVDLFNWAANAPKTKNDADEIPSKIAAVTGWPVQSINDIFSYASNVSQSRSEFVNEISLLKMQKLLKVASRIRMDIPRIFVWSTPLTVSHTWTSNKIAQDIKKAIRSRYTQGTWPQIAKSLNDSLRESQKTALISYLLAQDAIIKEGIYDADGLFEFFLIDVQMGAITETSRIKQAISSIQLFVQRCNLGLEVGRGVDPSALNRDRWDWMSKYRVWEANRKVFLYPEDWLQPSLRDDKSPIFQELESELLQKDITSDTISKSLQGYLYKLDSISNLRAIALYTDDIANRIHLFSRTYVAPYLYFYRYFDIGTSSWASWNQMQIEIPDYTTKLGENGAYICPIVWNHRLFVFIPQIVKHTEAASTPSTGPILFGSLNDKPISATSPVDSWQIKMSWSEYRAGSWTARQVSAEFFSDNAIPGSDPPAIDSYFFVPNIHSPGQASQNDTTNKVTVSVFRQNDYGVKATDAHDDKSINYVKVGAFDFNGGQLVKVDPETMPGVTMTPTDQKVISFGRLKSNREEISGDLLTSLQASLQFNSNQSNLTFKSFGTLPDVKYNGPESPDLIIEYDSRKESFRDEFPQAALGQLMSTGDVASVYSSLSSTPAASLSEYFGRATPLIPTDPPATNIPFYDELSTGYSLYNWEIGLHAPMILIDNLLQAQKFDDALNACHLVFDPLALGANADPSKVWVFPPFREIVAQTMEDWFMNLKPDDPSIKRWRDNPFQPHVVARGRPIAYMKWIVMKYIEILINYGDYYFMQNTLETVPQAIQMYVMASHLYGPRGQNIPRQHKVKPQTYLSLLDKWDDFSNAMVELELSFPFSNQTILPIGISPQKEAAVANIFGFASTLYFAIPDNPNLRALGAKIDDRLFKLRHSQDINGVTRILPLFEPPLDPGLLVLAAAKGLSLSTVLADLNGPMPNYRFAYLLQKALEICSELKSMGNAFVSAKEKKDSEAYAVLRQGYEKAINNMVMDVKKMELDDAQKSLDQLQYSRLGPVYRMQHNLRLIGGDPTSVPGIDVDFQEIDDQIQAPDSGSQLKLNSFESEEMNKNIQSQDFNIAIGALETLAGAFHAAPTIKAHATPLGVGAATSWGLPNLAFSTTAIARGLKIGADNLAFQASSAGLKAGHLRQLQDRIMQVNSAGYEIKSIDKQVLSSKIKVDIAARDLENQQKQIDQAAEAYDFLTNKYTNAELYTWMEGSLRTTFYQTYTQAYDIAKKAEKAYFFERPLEASTSFIQPGYWDPSRDGLMSGEQLYLGLKRLESAYNEQRGYDYEITKNISLRQLNPLQLISLRETNSCDFSIPEELYDMDFPGHYLRRIKSVSLTMPCIVGPYTSVNATLRLRNHYYRTSAIPKSSSGGGSGKYARDENAPSDSRFSTSNVPISAIAASTAQSDSGQFELNFTGERYVAFEGAGAISSWTLSLPSFRQFDYNTVTDAILSVKYTSLEGGDDLRSEAATHVLDWVKQAARASQEDGLFTVMDLRADFASEWYRAIAGASTGSPSDPRTMRLPDLERRLPVFTAGKKVTATDIYLVCAGDTSSGADFKVTSIPSKKGGAGVQSKEAPFQPGPKIQSLNTYQAAGAKLPFSGEWRLTFAAADTGMTQFWMLVRYAMN